MAHFVEAHNNGTGFVPGYWQPDGCDQVTPCDTQDQAVFLESVLDEYGYNPFYGSRDFLKAYNQQKKDVKSGVIELDYNLNWHESVEYWR